MRFILPVRLCLWQCLFCFSSLSFADQMEDVNAAYDVYYASRQASGDVIASKGHFMQEIQGKTFLIQRGPQGKATGYLLYHREVPQGESWRPVSEDTEWAGNVRIYVHELLILPKYRRQGRGKALLQDLDSKVKSGQYELIAYLPLTDEMKAFFLSVDGDTSPYYSARNVKRNRLWQLFSFGPSFPVVVYRAERSGTLHNQPANPGDDFAEPNKSPLGRPYTADALADKLDATMESLYESPLAVVAACFAVPAFLVSGVLRGGR